MTDPLHTTMRQLSEYERAGPGMVVGGRYELRTAIGHGGMGTVWRAVDGQLGRDVAVKEVVPPPGIAPEDRDAMYQRMMREARAAAGLSHPGIVQVYDVVTDGGRPWVVMELLDARSLADVVVQDGPLAPRAVAKVGLALLGALEVAHAAGVLHRDVKPANVLVCPDGRCVLTDFGVARMPSDQQLTTPGMVLGSPHFISPERAMGAPFGPPSDLFSLGVTLYATVEGYPPFDRGDPISTMHSVVEDEPPPPQRAGPLTEVLYGLLEKDPARRWDAPRARRVLRELLAGPLASSSTMFPTDPYSTVPAQRQPWQAEPGTRRASRVGGRALLAPGESPAERARAASDPYQGVPDPYQRVRDPYNDPHDHLGDTGAMPATAPPSPSPGPSPGRRFPAASGATPDRVAALRERTSALAGRARVVAGQTTVRIGRAGARGWAALRRAPTPVQVAVGGLAVLLLLGLGWSLGRNGGDRPDEDRSRVPVGQDSTGPVTDPPVDQPPFEVQEYQGRGVVVNLPVGWQSHDDPGLVYVDFADPDDADAEARLVVEAWSGDAFGLVGIAEETIRNNPACADPYQRVDLTDAVLAGRPAALLEYTCGEGATQTRSRWITVVHDDRAYSLRLGARESEFAERAVIFEEMMRSFRFTG